MKTARCLALMIAVLILDAANGTIVAGPAEADAGPRHRAQAGGRRRADGPAVIHRSPERGTARA